jgi:hypothetical protein
MKSGIGLIANRMSIQTLVMLSLATGRRSCGQPRKLASDVRVAGKKIETVSDGINEPVGNLDAAAFFGDVIPD